MADWEGGAENWDSAEAYCRDALVNENTGDPKDWKKSACHLPVKKDGTPNHAGMAAAAAALAGARGGYQGPNKKAAAKKLLGMYRTEKMDPPDSLKALAG